MDMRKRMAYARLKLTGQTEPVVINDGMSLIQLISRLGQAIHDLPPRYNKIQIEIDFNPIGEHKTQFEQDQATLLEGLIMGEVEIIDDDDPMMLRWHRNPMNKDSPNYDVLYEEYQRCNMTQHRERKTTEDLATIRKHVETHYAGSEWWDGSHKW